ncbi:MAG: FtsB family cell division protein [Roseiflexaceae bacterium]
MSQRTRTRSAGDRRRSTLREMLIAGRRRMTPTTIILLVVSVLFVYNFVVQVVRQTQLEQYRDSIAQNVIRLRDQNAALNRSVTYFESRDYAESVAREQLGYARPGDTVMMPTFPEQLSTTAPVVPVTPTTTAPSEPNWLRWWNMLSGGK